MNTITVEVDEDTYSALAKFSAADGRPIEELARVSLWHSACRLREPTRQPATDSHDSENDAWPMQTITCEVDSNTYQRLSELSVKSGRSIGESVRNFLWTGLTRVTEVPPSTHISARGGVIGISLVRPSSVLQYLAIAFTSVAALVNVVDYVNTSSMISLALFGIVVTFFLLHTADLFRRRVG